MTVDIAAGRSETIELREGESAEVPSRAHALLYTNISIAGKIRNPMGGKPCYLGRGPYYSSPRCFFKIYSGIIQRAVCHALWVFSLYL